MTTFAINTQYSTRSACDHDCIFTYTVTRRTEKSVWVKDSHGKEKRCKIYLFDNVESIFPEGHYSMAPIVRAA